MSATRAFSFVAVPRYYKGASSGLCLERPAVERRDVVLEVAHRNAWYRPISRMSAARTSVYAYLGSERPMPGPMRTNGSHFAVASSTGPGSSKGPSFLLVKLAAFYTSVVHCWAPVFPQEPSSPGAIWQSAMHRLIPSIWLIVGITVLLYSRILSSGLEMDSLSAHWHPTFRHVKRQDI